MTSRIALYLATIAQILNGMGAFILSADEVPFDLDARDVGLTMIWVATAVTFIVIAVRANLIPGTTTGVGKEIVHDANTGEIISTPKGDGSST